MILSLHDVSKTFVQGDRKIEVLRGLNLNLKKAETLAIVGPSGSGKSTLLSLLAGLDQPTEGTIMMLGKNLGKLSQNKLSKFRLESIGIVFQQFHLMPQLTAVENVMLPLQLHGESWSNGQERAQELLAKVGLAHRVDHFPSELSGGENQRVAIARSLILHPAFILADEPSGNLDETTSAFVMDLLFDLLASFQSTLLLVTHNLEHAKRCQRQLLLKGGRFEC